ncbi:MAG: hypothetical protein ACKV2V_25160 [Blastocatellia bacterium]
MSEHTDSFKLDGNVAARAKTPLIILAVIGWVLLAIGYFTNREQFHFSYHFAFIFCTTLTLGSLFFVIIQRLTTAGWSVVVRRIAETMAANLPIVALLFLPILFGVLNPPASTAAHTGAEHHAKYAYFEWLDRDFVNASHVLSAKGGYLEQKFFLIRALIYLLLWAGLGWYLHKQSVAHDNDGSESRIRNMFRVSAPGALLFFYTGALAAFDWIMSLSPHWFSTAFGVYVLAGGAMSFMATLILISVWLRGNNTLKNSITVEHYHDMGKLLFAFNVFWAYIGFSQYMLIWYANLPEETFWYHDRQQGSWASVSLLVAAGHFVIPFIFLLSRAVKRNTFTLSLAAGWLLLMHMVDVYWMVMPTLHTSGVHISWQDFAALAAVIGTLGFCFVNRLGKHSLVPVKDPFLAESLAFENV